MIPTDKEFWEKCGLKWFWNHNPDCHCGEVDDDDTHRSWYSKVDGEWKLATRFWNEDMELNLNNLFRYAVPENCSVSFNRTKDGTVCILAIPQGQYGSANYLGKGDKDEDAIALKLAIWGAIK